MLKERGIDFDYREYRENPLSGTEIRRLLALLGLAPKDVLRRRDRAFRELSLSGDETEGELIALMAKHPTLLERPIGVLGKLAVIGRPPEKLLALVEKGPSDRKPGT